MSKKVLVPAIRTQTRYKITVDFAFQPPCELQALEKAIVKSGLTFCSNIESHNTRNILEIKDLTENEKENIQLWLKGYLGLDLEGKDGE